MLLSCYNCFTTFCSLFCCWLTIQLFSVLRYHVKSTSGPLKQFWKSQTIELSTVDWMAGVFRKIMEKSLISKCKANKIRENTQATFFTDNIVRLWLNQMPSLDINYITGISRPPSRRRISQISQPRSNDGW